MRQRGSLWIAGALIAGVFVVGLLGAPSRTELASAAQPGPSPTPDRSQRIEPVQGADPADWPQAHFPFTVGGVTSTGVIRPVLVDTDGTQHITATWPTAVPYATPAALAAGENHLGAVGGNTLHPSANPVLTVASSYATGDYVGTSATPWSWTGCRTATGTGQLQSVTVIDKAVQSVAGELWLFDRSVTVPNDSAAWTITDADAQFLLGVVPVSTYYASAANSVASVSGIGMTIWCNGSSTLYGAWVTRGAPSYTSGDLTILLGLSVD